MRITVRNVRDRFAVFVEVARQCGLDVTGWTLQETGVMGGYRLGVRTERGSIARHPVADHIGDTAREAHSWLDASIKTMAALNRIGSR